MMGDKANVERVVYPQAAVCGLIYWPARKSILLLKKQPHKYEGGLWGCPGGKQELYERAEDAAWRENHEECGPALDMDNLHYHGVVGVVDDIIRPISKHYLTTIHFYTVREGRQPKVRNNEPTNHAAIDWFPWTRLPPNATTGFERVMEALTDNPLATLAHADMALPWGWAAQGV
jgi:ADP-ribose pyrophosphatase YjhB (NUDIX family)